MLTELMSWRDGQDVCERQAGYLAEIKTEEQQIFLVKVKAEKSENDFILQKLSRKVWLCLKRRFLAQDPGLLV